MEEKIENLRRELAADPDSSEDRLEYFASLRRASDESALALIADSARWKAAAPRDRDIALAWLQPKLGDSWDILGPCESAGDGELRFRHRGLGRDFLLINDGPPAPLLLARKSMAPSEFPARVQQTARGRLEVKAGPAEAWLRGVDGSHERKFAYRHQHVKGKAILHLGNCLRHSYVTTRSLL